MGFRLGGSAAFARSPWRRQHLLVAAGLTRSGTQAASKFQAYFGPVICGPLLTQILQRNPRPVALPSRGTPSVEQMFGRVDGQLPMHVVGPSQQPQDQRRLGSTTARSSLVCNRLRSGGNWHHGRCRFLPQHLLEAWIPRHKRGRDDRCQWLCGVLGTGCRRDYQPQRRLRALESLEPDRRLWDHDADCAGHPSVLHTITVGGGCGRLTALGTFCTSPCEAAAPLRVGRGATLARGVPRSPRAQVRRRRARGG